MAGDVFFSAVSCPSWVLANCPDLEDWKFSFSMAMVGDVAHSSLPPGFNLLLRLLTGKCKNYLKEMRALRYTPTISGKVEGGGSGEEKQKAAEMGHEMGMARDIEFKIRNVRYLRGRLWPKPGSYRNVSWTKKNVLQSLVAGIKQDASSSCWDVMQKVSRWNRSSNLDRELGKPKREGKHLRCGNLCQPRMSQLASKSLCKWLGTVSQNSSALRRLVVRGFQKYSGKSLWMCRGMSVLHETLKKKIQVGKRDANKKQAPNSLFPKQKSHSPARKQEGISLPFSSCSHEVWVVYKPGKREQRAVPERVWGPCSWRLCGEHNTRESISGRDFPRLTHSGESSSGGHVEAEGIAESY